MAPNSVETELPANDLIQEKSKPANAKARKNEQFKFYTARIVLLYYHIAALYGLYLCFTSAKWATIGFAALMYVTSTVGVAAGAHRLWSHRSYKAKLPLQIILMMFQSFAFQKTVLQWVRQHRLHHKFSDTDGDPHNATRGFFFSHFGWMLTKKSDAVIEGEKLINVSDILNNPVLAFQKKYAVPILFTSFFILPNVIPMYFWGETLNNAYHLNMLRYILVLNVVMSINSFAHRWGSRPYDKNMLPTQNNILSFFFLGEGFHNYHHAFPWDYQSAELGNMKLNFSTWFIDFFAWVGWAYDLKKASDEVVKRRAERTGDGTDLWGAIKCTNN